MSTYDVFKSERDFAIDNCIREAFNGRDAVAFHWYSFVGKYSRLMMTDCLT